MAYGAVVMRLTDSMGQITSYGVPGEDDANEAWWRTRPLELGSPDVEKFVSSIVNEFTGDTNGLKLYYRPKNRLKDGGDFVFLGDIAGDGALFLDETMVTVMRFIELEWRDNEANDWQLSEITIWGEAEGDVDQLE